MNDRKAGIEKLREIAASLERGDDVVVMFSYTTTDGRLAYMSFGNPIVVDALLMHSMRVSFRNGTIEEIAEQ